MVTVRSLHIYPLKSGRGTEVREARLERRGLEGDRRWMVVAPDGVFVTQREIPGLCQVDARMGPGGLELRAPGRDPVFVSYPEGPTCEVRVWSDIVQAVPAAHSASAWLSDVLGRPLILVYMPEDTVRPVEASYGEAGDRVSFADGFPLLLISEGSLAALNQDLPEPVTMDRFRPNLVVSGADEPYAEDRWRRVRVGEVILRIVKSCARCVITTTDQVTAERGAEPLRTLGRTRRHALGALFGQNAIPDRPGLLRTGMPIEVLEFGPPAVG